MHPHALQKICLQELVVSGNLMTMVVGNLMTMVFGNLMTVVSGNLMTMVSGNLMTMVFGNLMTVVFGNLLQRVALSVQVSLTSLRIVTARAGIWPPQNA
jgi:hypothetical protein